MKRDKFRLAPVLLTLLVGIAGCERASSVPDTGGAPLQSSLDAEVERLENLTTAFTSPLAPAASCTGRDEDTVLCRRDASLARIALLREQSTAVRTKDEEGISSGPFLFHCAALDGLLRVTYVRSDPALAFITRLRSSIVMKAAPSASGARYTGALPDQLFWEHQGVARYREGADQPEVECVPDAGA
jgi:hypothetical protein